MQLRKLLCIFCLAVLLNSYYICNAYSINTKTDNTVRTNSLTYFDAVRSFKADFMQISSSEDIPRYGYVLMKKPGLLKWDYYPPTPVSIVIKGTTISYYDRELEEYSYTIVNNPIIGLLSSDIKNISTIDFINIDTVNNQKIVTLHDKKSDLYAEVIFNTDPITIVGLNILNPDSKTSIQFYNISSNIPIDKREFKHDISHYYSE
ncbi:putative exported protein [Ehrlichia ruminantium]|uniref:outer membrane lipoprotein carrier protein LolA n=1 Tax=Ehrlichia ruminantium TaxID=779 RepID=UPI0007C1344B|nr:outer membrane lipoprotein carrier protein LolA [Ehrlichia ruminantium]QLK52735.1 outer membrane lipoprotein carrier protein LolA [Ehrlichia ruminantium]QLK54569.1 outer membrane lipoprotein carrier protein LolA [Ehrlichia ruminantium]QLK57318.1 outer membrane lipoprotein carrier protein LolA [Ehrlichia ruminantium]GAT76668.1 putative exported protein [Ehrlichia ruminantium]